MDPVKRGLPAARSAAGSFFIRSIQEKKHVHSITGIS